MCAYKAASIVFLARANSKRSIVNFLSSRNFEEDITTNADKFLKTTDVKVYNLTTDKNGFLDRKGPQQYLSQLLRWYRKLHARQLLQ